MVQDARRSKLLLEAGIVTVAAIVSVFVHSRFMIEGFGEPDAARLAVQAVSWHNSGSPIVAYTVRTSPLYLFMLKARLDGGMALATLPVFMNWLSAVTGGLSLIPMYWLWRRLSNVGAAALACALFSVTPTFWLGQIYGMPHMPSFFFFLVAVLIFSFAVKSNGPRFQWLCGIALVPAVLAVALKADIILCFGAFVGVAFCMRALNWRNTIAAGAIGALALTLTLMMARAIVPGMDGNRDRRHAVVRALSVRKAGDPRHHEPPCADVRDRSDPVAGVASVGRVLPWLGKAPENRRAGRPLGTARDAVVGAKDGKQRAASHGIVRGAHAHSGRGGLRAGETVDGRDCGASNPRPGGLQTTCSWHRRR